tara:strand:+ start:5628 stop:5867 length:240 start_codon:yes stop_codon:yes gene_type:complete
MIAEWDMIFNYSKINKNNIASLTNLEGVKYSIVKTDDEQLIISSNGIWTILVSDDCRIIDNKIICDDWERPNTYTINYK